MWLGMENNNNNNNNKNELRLNELRAWVLSCDFVKKITGVGDRCRSAFRYLTLARSSEFVKCEVTGNGGNEAKNVVCIEVKV